MKKTLSILLIATAYAQFSFAQSPRPIQSDAMYYQLRSMETGPWEFKPEAYYYSWVRKHRRIAFVKWSWDEPGLGVHDRGPAGIGGGDKYVRRYAPSSQLRAQMLALSAISLKQYEAIEKQHKAVGEREAIDAADRQFDVTKSLYDPKINTLVFNIQSLCNTLNNLSPAKYSSEYLQELRRIESNIKMIHKSYIRNGERAKAYLKEIKSLEGLSKRLQAACMREYASQRLENISLSYRK